MKFSLDKKVMLQPHTMMYRKYTVKLQQEDWCLQKYLSSDLHANDFPQGKVIITLICEVKSSGNCSFINRNI